jgi:hypothetical protein
MPIVVKTSVVLPSGIVKSRGAECHFKASRRSYVAFG